MFRKIVEFFPFKHCDSEYIIRKKAISILAISVMLIILTITLIITTRLRGHTDLQLQAPLFVIFFTTIVSIYLLGKCHYTTSAHLILIVLLSSVWFILFFDTNQPVLVRLTTMIYIPAILMISPLFIIKRRIVIIAYYSINLLIFVLFGYVISKQMNLSFYEISGFITDHIVVIVFTGTVSFYLFSINQSALDLSKSKEMEIEAQKEELQATNEELEAINEELIASNVEFELINEELRQSKNKIADSERKYKSLYDNPLVGMFTSTLLEGHLLNANELAVKMFGYSSRKELVGKISVEDLYYNSDDRKELISRLQERGEINNFEIRLKRKDSTHFWGRVSAKLYPDERKLEGTIVDITKTKLAEENIHRLTYYDQLTGLPNKRMFYEELKYECAKQS